MLAQFVADEPSHLPPCRRGAVTGVGIGSQVLSLWKPGNNDGEGKGSGAQSWGLGEVGWQLWEQEGSAHGPA